MTERPEALVHEFALAMGQGEALEHLQKIGKPSSFVCPDCHGGLWHVEGSRPMRFRCHTGHAFTARTLENALSTKREEAIWNALRAVQEHRMQIFSMIDRTGPQVAAEEAMRLETTAAQLYADEAMLRQIIERKPDAAQQ